MDLQKFERVKREEKLKRGPKKEKSRRMCAADYVEKENKLLRGNVLRGNGLLILAIEGIIRGGRKWMKLIDDIKNKGK